MLSNYQKYSLSKYIYDHLIEFGYDSQLHFVSTLEDKRYILNISSVPMDLHMISYNFI